MSETLGYDNIQDEVLDNNNEKIEINEAIKNSLEEEDKLNFECISKMNSEKLGQYLSREFFPDGKTKNYSEIQSNKYINFHLKAALQLIGKNNTKKYKDNGELRDDGKTIDEYLQEKGGLTNIYDEGVVKFLQNVVGAHPDGKAGPQTIWKIITALGYDASNLAEGVNNLYEGNDKFQVMSIGKISNGGIEYKYNQNKITISADGGDGTFKLEFDENGNLTTPGLKINNGWIVIDNNKVVATDGKEQIEKKRNDNIIKSNLAGSGLENDNELIKIIKTKKHELDSLDYKGRFFIIKDGKISTYSNKTTYDNMLKQETGSKWLELKKEKVEKILLEIDSKLTKTRKDSNGNILFESLPGVSFQSQDQMTNFKIDIKKVINKRAYSLNDGNSPFKISSRENIYCDTEAGKRFLEDNHVINGKINNMKNIEEFKKNIKKDELNTIVGFLNKLNCRSIKEKFNNIGVSYIGL